MREVIRNRLETFPTNIIQAVQAIHQHHIIMSLSGAVDKASQALEQGITGIGAFPRSISILIECDHHTRDL